MLDSLCDGLSKIIENIDRMIENGADSENREEE
jgi:hypothetical protein